MPLSMRSELMALRYWHKLARRCAAGGSLPLAARVLEANKVRGFFPWLTGVRALLADYRFTESEALSWGPEEFASLLAARALERLRRLWTTTGRAAGVTQRYNTAFAALDLRATGVRDIKAAQYFLELGSLGYGRSAGLCAQLRMECLPLAAARSRAHGRPTTQQLCLWCAPPAAAPATGGQQQQQPRQQQPPAPVAPARAETEHHFLLCCPAGRPRRRQFVTDLRAERGGDALWRRIASGGDDGWRLLMGDGLRDPKLVSDYVLDIWQLRDAALTGRGTDGRGAGV